MYSSQQTRHSRVDHSCQPRPLLMSTAPNSIFASPAARRLRSRRISMDIRRLRRSRQTADYQAHMLVSIRQLSRGPFRKSSVAGIPDLSHSKVAKPKTLMDVHLLNLTTLSTTNLPAPLKDNHNFPVSRSPSIHKNSVNQTTFFHLPP